MIGFRHIFRLGTSIGEFINDSRNGIEGAREMRILIKSVHPLPQNRVGCVDPRREMRGDEKDRDVPFTYGGGWDGREAREDIVW